MNIKELRVGNIVTTNGKPMNTEYGEMYKISDYDSQARLECDSQGRTIELNGCTRIETNYLYEHDTVGAWVDYLEPISITEDILIKIGFSKGYYGDFNIKIDDYVILVHHDIDNESFRDIFNLLIYKGYNIIILKAYDIEYMHKLQNLIYTITDLELGVDTLLPKGLGL